MVLAPKHKRPSTSINHKKRYGQHRKHTKPYLQTYWPYLPLLAIVGLGLIVNSLWFNGSRGVLGYATDISTPTLLADTNAERTQNHEPALALNNDLTTAAQTKANNMAELDYWSHDTPSGEQPWVFIKQAGYNYQSAGENLAYGFSTSDATLAGWMNSVSHRANILDANYQDVGFGIANATNYQGTGPETIVVAMYGQPIGAQTTALSSPTAAGPEASVAGSSASPSIMAQPASQRVSRIQVVTDGSAPWSLFAVSILATFGVAIVIIRHSLSWRRAVLRSEALIIRHPWFDATVVGVAVIGFILSRTAGTIL